MRWRRRAPLTLPADPDCHQVSEVLQAYLDGELEPEDADAVTHHLDRLVPQLTFHRGGSRPTCSAAHL